MGRVPIARCLRRYTDLPGALHVLQNRCVTLLPPLSWDDKNDRAAMQRYAQASGHKSVLGLCLSQAAETFHHWKVFAPGQSGVCIEFRKQDLLAQVPRTGYQHKEVQYQNPTEFLAGYPTPSELPFIKGSGYRHEIEYRIVFADETEGRQSVSFPVTLDSIRSIVLSPMLPSALAETVRSTINRIPGCEGIPVTHSKVVENEAWIQYVNRTP